MRALFAAVPVAVLLFAHTEARADQCAIAFGQTTCPAKMGSNVVSLGTDQFGCMQIGTQAQHPITYYSWSKTLLPAACSAANYPATVPVTVCWAKNDYTPIAQWSLQASCNPTPVHLLIKSWTLDMNSLKVNANAPCTVQVNSVLTVTNVGTADYTGPGEGISESCEPNRSCGNQQWSGEVPIAKFLKGEVKIFRPTSGIDSPFLVDCTPAKLTNPSWGGSYLAKWKPCHADITCDPATAVATPDLVSVCPTAKSRGLLNACK
jgi:hypothetical protein